VAIPFRQMVRNCRKTYWWDLVAFSGFMMEDSEHDPGIHTFEIQEECNNPGLTALLLSMPV